MRKITIIIIILLLIAIPTAIYFYPDKEKLKDLNPLSQPDEPTYEPPPVYHITGTITPKIELNLQLYNNTILIDQNKTDTINFQVLEQSDYTIKYSDPSGIYYGGEVKTPFDIKLQRIGELIILDENQDEIILDTITTFRNLRNNFEFFKIKVSTPNNTILKNVKIQGTHNGGLYAVSVINRGSGTATIDTDLLNPLITIPTLSPQDDCTFEYRLHGREDLEAGTYKITITAEGTFKRDMYVFWTG